MLHETSIAKTPLTEMAIDTGTSEPVSQKPYPIVMKHYQWVKDEIDKLLMAKVIWGSQSSWSAPIIVVPKGDEGKHLVTDYHTLNRVKRKFIWPMPTVEDICSQLNGTKYFSTLDLQAGYHHIPLDESSLPKTAFTSPLGKYEYIKVPFGLAQPLAYLPRTHDRHLKRFQLCNCLSAWHYHLQQDSRRTPQPHQASFWKINECTPINETQQVPSSLRKSVPRTHPQHHGHQTPTIKNTSHKRHAPTKNTKTSMHISWTCGIL